MASDTRGALLGLGAYVTWGLFPAFWPLLDPAGPIEVLAHRILWTLVLMAAVLLALGGWGNLRTLSGRGWLLVTAAALVIAANWASSSTASPSTASSRSRSATTRARRAAR